MKKENHAVYLAQPNCGDVHEILNVSMIIILDKIYESVKVYAPKDCCEVIECALKKMGYDLSSIFFIHTKVYTKKQLPFWFICGIQEFTCMLKNRNSDLYFSTLNFLWFPIFNASAFLFKGQLFTLCHNDLEHLINPIFGKLNLRWRLINYIFKKMRFSKNNFCLVLGKSIKNNLFKYAKKETITGNIISINHPYYSENAKTQKKNNGNTKKIAIVGAIKWKDKENIEKLNHILTEAKSVEMYSISISDFDLTEYKNITVLNKGNKHLPRNQYDDFISEMDALYFPYSENTYRVSASGAVYEAISKNKLIISTENDYFKDLFSEFGEMGFLFKDFKELQDIFSDLSNEEKTSNFLKNEAKATEFLSPMNYSDIFMKQVFRING
ncbi:MAG: hypothetical protein MJZ22_00470 [Candidatus Saccharibacteria bacterium]|nr:hypothetical protein [Candidatus Saccharibacteria bacterium]